MKVELIAALGALAMGVSAQTTVPPAVQQSVLMVLATALPSESVSFAISSQSAFAAQIASSMAAGHTPAWYQSLPADVKSLLPIIYKVQATPTPTSSASPSASAKATTTSAHATSSSSSASPAATSNAAALPRAAVGVGVGAALGFVGMLAL